MGTGVGLGVEDAFGVLDPGCFGFLAVLGISHDLPS